MTGPIDPGVPEPLGPGNAAALAVQRLIMVESQVRPNHVNDRRVIEAMRRLPREQFAPAGVAAGALAYADTDMPLGNGRYMLAPMLIGRLAQLVLADNPSRVLVVGAGAGYGAALLAACGAEVVALEEDEAFFAGPAPRSPGVQRVRGRLALGWPAGGPYEAILIEGAVQAIPPAFATQLAPRGRVVAILAEGVAETRRGIAAGIGAAGVGRAVLAEPVPRGFATVTMFDCTARPLPAFRPAPVFDF